MILIAKRVVVPLLPLLLTACAMTGMRGGSIAIDVTSNGAALAGATCIVSTDDGISRTVSAPGSVYVAVNGDLHVVCEKPGYQTTEAVFQPAYETNAGNSSLGIGLGGGSGNVGLGLGLSFPLGFGSGGYPVRIKVEMHPQ